MKTSLRIFSIFILLALTFGAMGVTPVYAATQIVTSNLDTGPGSLRAAIANAAAGDTITFSGDMTISLASELTIAKNLTVDGGTHSVTVSGNHSTRVFNVTAGTITFNHLTIADGNVQTTDCGIWAVKCGGGLMLQNNSAIYVTVANSTFSGNSATDFGGGIDKEAGTLTVANSTFSGNSATYVGGGIDQEAGTLTVTNSTFSGNSAAHGGGIDMAGGSILTVKNTIIANNTGGNCYSVSSNSGTNNLANDDTCGGGFTNSASILLGTLGNYGGPTQTFPLLPGSVAIDAGDSATCAAAPVSGLDQRGVARPSACDIGAFESRGFTLAKTGGDNQSATINTAFTDPLALNVTSSFSEPVNGGKVTFTPPGSGASAVITGSPATIASGAASVSATANGTAGGSYNVTASASGATGVDFSLTNTPVSHTVTFNANLGSGSMSPQTANAPTALIANAFTRANFFFSGWNSAADGSGASYADGVTYDFSADLTLYAQWTCAPSITVTSNADSNTGSLRQAIADVCPGGTITFDNDYTIPLASELTISKNLTIDGETHSVTVSGNHSTRVFNVTAGTITFNHLTIADGNVQTTDCGTWAAKCGGGMILQNSGVTVTVTNSTFSGNSATYGGGGIDQEAGTLTVTNSTFSGNSASWGGGIVNKGTLNVTNSTFSGNSATYYGGGIDSDDTLNVTNSTFSGNSAAYGGGIDIVGGSISMVKNTILANNAGGNCNGVVSGTNNLVNDNTCGYGFTNSASILLGTLGNYGGPTQTFPLLPGSAAIDAGDSATCAAAPVSGLDQRGITRPQGAACDIGAYEAELLTVTANNKTITYGDPDPTFDFTSAPAGATFSTPPTCSVSGAHTSAGTYTIACSGAVPTDGKYILVYVDGTLTINKATPTATLAVSNSPVTYDGAAHAATVSVSVSSVPGAAGNIDTGGAASQTNAGSYAVTADFTPTDTTNYNSLTGLSAGDFVINKATATIQVTPYNVSYDGAAHTASGTATGILGADLSAGLDLSGTTHTNIGSYPGDPWTFNDGSGNYNAASSTVTDNILDPAKAITAFDFTSPAATGVIDEAAHTIALTVPFGTNVTALVPTITHTGASVSPKSGVAHDFSSPATYTVTAADASTQAYTVTVTVAPNNAPVITEGDSVTVTMPENGSPTPFALTLHATDANLDPLTWSIQTLANHGTAGAAAGPGTSSVITYTPSTNYTGVDSFVVQVSDGNGGTDSITVNVTIQPPTVVSKINSAADTGDGQIDEAEHTPAAITQLLVVFNNSMDVIDAQNTANYSLVQNVSTPVTINGIVYDGPSHTATLNINTGVALLEGKYTLTVKGAIHDSIGQVLGADFIRVFFIDTTGIKIITNGVTLPDHTVIVDGATLSTAISEIWVTFNEDAANPTGDTAKEDVTNPANYLLVRPGVNAVFDTAACLTGPGGDDVAVPAGPVTYDNGGGNGPFVAKVRVNNGSALENGIYRLFVCGTTSITDLAGNHLNNGADSKLSFTVLALTSSDGNGGKKHLKNPTTGFEPGVFTALPWQPAEKAYADLGDLWLEIPSLGVKASITGVPLLEQGWDLTWLHSQVGWLEGTAYPTWNGNTVLTAHAYTSDGLPGPFALLKNLKYGDTFIIHFNAQEYTYTVRSKALVNADDTRLLTRHEELDWVTLITCQQFDEKSNTYLYRWVVRAVLTSVQDDK